MSDETLVADYLDWHTICTDAALFPYSPMLCENDQLTIIEKPLSANILIGSKSVLKSFLDKPK